MHTHTIADAVGGLPPWIFSLSKGFFTLHFLLQMWWETPWLLLSFTTYLADAATDALTALLLLQAT